MNETVPSVDDGHSLGSFFILWGGQALSLIGSQIVQFALIWYLTSETRSGTVLASASLVGLLPHVVLGPFAGVLVDRWSRRWVMFWADSAIALATLVLAVLFAVDVVQTWHIFLVLFVRSLGGAFHGAAMSASTPLMVPTKYLTRIAGFNQMLQGGLNIITAPLGALAIGTLSMQAVLAIDIGTAAFAIVPLLFIAVPQPPARTQSLNHVRRSLFSDMREGFAYVWNWRGLRTLIFSAVVLNFLLSPAFSLLPLLVAEHFGGGAMQLGIIESGIGFGILAGGLLLGVWGGFQRKMLTTLTGIVGIGLGTLLLGMSPANLFGLAVVAGATMGLSQPLANGPIMAVMQEIVEPDKQGRVMTLLSSLAMGATPIGLAIAGPVSDLIGIRTWFLLGGTMCLVMVLYTFNQPDFMNLDQSTRASTPADNVLTDVSA